MLACARRARLSSFARLLLDAEGGGGEVWVAAERLVPTVFLVALAEARREGRGAGVGGGDGERGGSSARDRREGLIEAGRLGGIFS